MKTTYLLAGTLSTLLLAGSHTTDGAENVDTLTVDVMSFNIRYGTARDGENRWDRRKEQVCDVIRRQAPAAIGLQEALRFQIDDIRKALPEYGEIGVGREKGNKGEYSAILYRLKRFDVDRAGTFWLSDTPDVPSRHWGNVCIRICTWARLVDKRSGQAFYLYNTHLDHQSQPSREKSVRLIVRHMQQRTHQDPPILTGDFNAAENNMAITYLKGTGGNTADRSPIPLVDAYRVLHPDEKQVGTFNGFAGRSNGAKIDYIFVTPGTRVLKAAIIRAQKDGRCPSDHYPVTATLQFPAPSTLGMGSGT